MVSGKISTPLSSCVWVYSYQVSFTYEGVEGAPPPTWAASAGPEDNNLEVKLYWDTTYGMLVQEMENISGSKARSVATVSYTHLRAHETRHDLVCRLLLEKKKCIWPTSIIKPQINGVLLLLLYCCNTRLTQLRCLRFQFQLKPSLPHYSPLIQNVFHFLHQHTVYFIPVQLDFQVIVFWPRRSRPCRRRGPVYEEKHQNIWSK